ncbi:aldo/keto reductase [Pleomorphomonas sp. PLEO]|uniref:aldo/keto reductase n=1 Tax=Pleomorphomonas sp. PLEO TaxID=3239306 RepID=UPI00351E6515
MKKRPLGKTGFDIAPLVFGGNVFGWTIDEKASFDVLDAFVDHGFDAIDTADVYSRWKPGNQGGESETIIGRWLKARPGVRDKVKIFTKVGSDLGLPGEKGLGEKWVLQAVDRSLARLGIDRIDLYFSHWPDETPYEETLGAYDKLIRGGKVRAIGASNVNAEQLGAALSVSRQQHLPTYQVLQPNYSLAERGQFDGALRDLCMHEDIGVIPYYSLASGFLTGKYRSADDLKGSSRAGSVEKYINARGFGILSAIDQVAEAHHAKPAEVALAWLMARPGITAPIASATKVAHVESFAHAATLHLAPAEIDLLDKASA